MKNTKKTTEILYWIILSIVIIIGITIRTDVWLNEPSFFGDETTLLSNIINRNFIGIFSALDSAQSCPTFFLLVNKIIYSFFSLNETALRFFSYLCGIFSLCIIPFFKDLLFKNKSLNLLLIVMLTLNGELLYYSQEFKQYSSDVFFTLLILLLFFKTKDKVINLKSALIVGVIFGIAGFFSFTLEFLVFSICLYFIYIFIRNKSYKPILGLTIPYFFGLLIQYILVFHGTLTNGIMECWSDEPFAFETFNSTIQTISSLTTNLLNEKIVFAIFMIGIIICIIKDKLLAYILIMPILLNMISGLLDIYPFTNSRVILYLSPIFIILSLKTFDVIPTKNKLINTTFGFFILLTILSLYIHANDYINKTPIGDKSYYYIRSNAREYINHLDKREIKPTDKIFVDDQSAGAFDIYYKEKNYDENIIFQSWQNQLSFNDRDTETQHMHLNELPKGTNIWFYNTPHYPNEVRVEEINEWINENTKILLSEKDDMGELLYVEKIK